MNLRVHYLQHVPFEGLGCMYDHFQTMGYRLSSSNVSAADDFPNIDDIDWLIVMGGPMGVGDENRFPWLHSEKAYIERAIDSGKTVLGICLGAQLIADVLGARIISGACCEIGWHAVERTPEACHTILDQALPASFEAYHWHADMFEIPANAVRLASSPGCINQGFIVEDRVIGLQCHLEMTMAGARELISACWDEHLPGDFVQCPEQMLAQPSRFDASNAVMIAILKRLEQGMDGRKTNLAD